MNPYKDLSREELQELLKDAARNWPAHDGLWFRAVEERYGLETAIALDKKAWEQFAVIEFVRRPFHFLKLMVKISLYKMLPGFK